MSNKPNFRKMQNPDSNGGGRKQPVRGPIIDLSKIEPFKCKAEIEKLVGQEALFDSTCNSVHFEPVVQMKVISALVPGNTAGHAVVAPMMPPNADYDWKCVRCGRIYTTREIAGE